MHNKKSGNILLSALIFGSAAFVIIVSGVVSYAIGENRASNRTYARDLSFQIAEAGIDYYRWHLAHNPTDFSDGTGGAPGPYVHTYEDKDGNDIGSFSLEIDAPGEGESVVVVRSTGWTNEHPETKRTIQVHLGFESFADFAYLSNSSMWFGFTADVHGKIHSNGGIRFDGTTDSWVSSAKDRYQYENQTHNGIWGGGGPKSFWVYPVPPIDFNAVTADLANLRDLADSGGRRQPSSGDEGWHFEFIGDEFNIYRVTSRDCYYGAGRWRGGRWNRYWDGDIYCYDIDDETFIETVDIPENGVIFVEDHVWVDGVVDGRVTIVAARADLQEPYRNIYVTGNLTYNEIASDDVTGLISQGDILVPYEVPDEMTIQAAMLSQFGRLLRPYYYEDTRELLTIFGSQISYASGGWAYVNGWGHIISGFLNRNHTYDGNLRFSPPPGFPVGDTYELLSWEEI